jgi:hypothetical protein
LAARAEVSAVRVAMVALAATGAGEAELEAMEAIGAATHIHLVRYGLRGTAGR